MGFMYVLLAMTMVAAYTQAAATYRAQPIRQVDPRGGSYGRRDYNPPHPATYGGGSGVFTRTDNSHLVHSSTRGGSYPGNARRHDSSNRPGQGSGYNAGGVRRDGYAERRPTGSYDAGRLVKDLIYNPRLTGSGGAGGPGYDSGRQVGGYGSGGPARLRDCNCRRSEVCERDQQGRPYCRPGADGYVPGNPHVGARSGCLSDSSIFNKCNVHRGITAFIFHLGSCQIFTTNGRDHDCQPNTVNNIFRSMSECTKHCGL